MRFIVMCSLLCSVLASATVLAQDAATGQASETAAEVSEIAQPGQAAEPAATPASGVGAGLAAAPEGKGQIVFFRDKKFTGGAISYIVREGEEELGKLSNGSYFVYVAEPGPHAYTVHSEAKDVLNLEVEAGETYYVVGSISMGILAGRPNLSPSDQAAFEALAGKIKPAKPLKNKG